MTKEKEENMKKLIIIIFFLITIQYEGNVYAETNETIKEQEKNLGISSFISEAENYTKDIFSDIDVSSIYEDAISGKIQTSGIGKTILKVAGKEVANTVRTLGYILIIVVVHGIIKSVSEGLGNRRSRKNHLLYTIHINCYFSNGEFFRDNSFDKRHSK